MKRVQSERHSQADGTPQVSTLGELRQFVTNLVTTYLQYKTQIRLANSIPLLFVLLSSDQLN